LDGVTVAFRQDDKTSELRVDPGDVKVLKTVDVSAERGKRMEQLQQLITPSPNRLPMAGSSTLTELSSIDVFFFLSTHHKSNTPHPRIAASCTVLQASDEPHSVPIHGTMQFPPKRDNWDNVQ
jgi:hypothetical protein